jgi:MerR family transcriptional regulator/heat shock protein HspR
MTDDRPVYIISIAAELVGMHPQTLRVYEQRGLVQPKRTKGNTRLYSQVDIDRLRLIQQLTTELGLNLAGVEHVMRLQDELERMRLEMDEMRRQMNERVAAIRSRRRG